MPEPSVLAMRSTVTAAAAAAAAAASLRRVPNKNADRTPAMCHAQPCNWCAVCRRALSDCQSRSVIETFSCQSI